MKEWGGRSCVLDKEQRFSERERERERYSPMWHFEEKKAKPIASIYRKNDFFTPTDIHSEYCYRYKLFYNIFTNYWCDFNIFQIVIVS